MMLMLNGVDPETADGTHEEGVGGSDPKAPLPAESKAVDGSGNPPGLGTPSNGAIKFLEQLLINSVLLNHRKILLNLKCSILKLSGSI